LWSGLPYISLLITGTSPGKSSKSIPSTEGTATARGNCEVFLDTLGSCDDIRVDLRKFLGSSTLLSKVFNNLFLFSLI
jgi:hypothetical protein